MFALARRSVAQAKLDAVMRSQASILFALDGTVVDANPNFLDLMGYRLEEVRGRPHSVFVDPAESAGAPYKAFWDALRRGEFQSAEYRRLGKGGREVWIRATYSPVLGGGGRPTHILKLALDITAEKQADAERTSQIAAINRSQAVVHFALDGTVEDANEHFLAALGYSLDEIQGRHHSLFVEEAHAASEEYRAFWENLARGAYHAGEFKRRGKGGREVWIQATYNPVFDSSGRPFKVVKYAADVTAAKQIAMDMVGTVNAARRSQAVVAFDLEGHVLDANENFLTVLGYEFSEIAGRHHRMFVTPGYAESPAYAAFWDDLRAGRFTSAIYPRIGKGGRKVWIQATYNPVLDLNGRPCKIIKFATDVTHSMDVRASAISAAEQTLSRVQTVALASEDMHRTSSAIATQMLRSNEAMGQIHARMQTADTATVKLGEAAQAMNSVVEAITAIAEQINLLALNATIEAARAGAAGRGFSVVAAEVKNLAGQAQSATSRISGEIAAMQSVARDVSATLASIRGAVDDVQGFVSQTAVDSERQRAITGEVSANVRVTAAGVSALASSFDAWLVGVEERRSGERARVFLSATIEEPATGGTVPELSCMVVNLSATGAKLAFPESTPLPTRFLLRMEGGQTHTCQVIRQSGPDVGVRFMD